MYAFLYLKFHTLQHPYDPRESAIKFATFGRYTEGSLGVD